MELLPVHEPEQSIGAQREGDILRSMCHVAEVLRANLADRRDFRVPHQSTGIMFEKGTDGVDIGRVRSLEMPDAGDIIVTSTSRRIRGDGRLAFRLSPISTACDVDLIAFTHAIVAHIEMSDLPAQILYSVEVAPAAASIGCIDIIVPLPAGVDEGTEVVLRSVSIAGCNIELGAVPMRVIVGFNHAPAPAALAFAAVRVGDIAALTQALDNGCSTREADMVSSRVLITGGNRHRWVCAKTDRMEELTIVRHTFI
jgi:hypothetical protein